LNGNNSYFVQKRILPFAVIATILLAYALSSNYIRFGHYDDDVKWVLMARQFLHFSHTQPWQSFGVQELINWGTSLVIAPVVAVTGGNIPALKLFMSGLLISGILLFFSVTRNFFTAREIPFYLFALTLNSFLLSFSGAVISESVYIFLFALALYLLYRHEWLRGMTPMRALAFGALCSLIILTRTAGVLFLACICLELLRQRAYRSLLLIAAATALFSLPYFVISKTSSGDVTFYRKYWQLLLSLPLAGILDTARANAVYYWKGLTCLTHVQLPYFFPDSTTVKYAVMAGMAVPFLLGITRIRNRVEKILLAYTLLYGLLYVLWSYRAPRYALPFYPLYVFWIFRGIQRISAGKAFVAWSIMGLLTAASIVSNASSMKEIITASLRSPVIIGHESYDWLAAESKADDLIVSMDIARIHYFTGRKGISFIASDSAGAFASRAKTLNAAYFLLRDSTFTDAAPNVNDPIAGQYEKFRLYTSDRRYFTLLYEDKNEGVRIFKLR